MNSRRVDGREDLHLISMQLLMTRLQNKGEGMKVATFEDAVALAQKLNLNRELVWQIIEGRRYSTLTDLAMAIQEAFALPDTSRRSNSL